MPVYRPEKLTAKQIDFCHEVANMPEADQNLSEAARRAGYSERTADVQASTLMKKPAIKAYIDSLKNDQQRKTDVTADRIVAELAKIAFSSAADLIDADTDEMKKIAKIEGDVQAALQSIEHDDIYEDGEFKGRKVKVRMYDKIKALEMLGKRFNLFNDKYQISLGEGVQFNMSFGGKDADD